MRVKVKIFKPSKKNAKIDFLGEDTWIVPTKGIVSPGKWALMECKKLYGSDAVCVWDIIL